MNENLEEKRKEKGKKEDKKKRERENVIAERRVMEKNGNRRSNK